MTLNAVRDSGVRVGTCSRHALAVDKSGTQHVSSYWLADRIHGGALPDLEVVTGRPSLRRIRDTLLRYPGVNHVG